ncbi:MAG TPA: hypothetical protein EYG72_02660 [Candidatus Pacebacteria bacterium]|nr:hypothetical protein [Candidatus Paceibacterota bacterium]
MFNFFKKKVKKIPEEFQRNYIDDDFREFIENDDFHSIKGRILEFYSDDYSIAHSLYNLGNTVAQEYLNHNLSIKLYQEAILYDKNDPSFYNNLATEYKRIDDFENAKNFYAKSFEVDPNYLKGYLRLAMLFAYLGNSESAFVIYSVYLKRDGSEEQAEHIMKITTQGGNELINIINNYRKSDKDFADDFSHIANLLLLSASDGEVDKTEINLIKVIAQQRGIPDNIFIKIVDNFDKFEFIVPKSINERISQLSDMIMLMLIDGEIEKNEAIVCTSAAIKFGFSDKVVIETIKEGVEILGNGGFPDWKQLIKKNL